MEACGSSFFANGLLTLGRLCSARTLLTRSYFHIVKTENILPRCAIYILKLLGEQRGGFNIQVCIYLSIYVCRMSVNVLVCVCFLLKNKLGT